MALGASNRPDPAKRDNSAGTGFARIGPRKPDDKLVSVTAKRGDTRYGICSTDFLEEAFRTESYRCDITFNDDGSWTYLIETELLVKGRDRPFNHHDTNTLKLVEAPSLNPLAVTLKDNAKQK